MFVQQVLFQIQDLFGHRTPSGDRRRDGPGPAALHADTDLRILLRNINARAPRVDHFHCKSPLHSHASRNQGVCIPGRTDKNTERQLPRPCSPRPPVARSLVSTTPSAGPSLPGQQTNHALRRGPLDETGQPLRDFGGAKARRSVLLTRAYARQRPVRFRRCGYGRSLDRPYPANVALRSARPGSRTARAPGPSQSHVPVHEGTLVTGANEIPGVGYMAGPNSLSSAVLSRILSVGSAADCLQGFLRPQDRGWLPD